MSERKLYWRRAADWGAMLGLMIVALESLIWLFNLGSTGALVVMMLIEIAMIVAIWISGKQNVFTPWSRPYGYGRSLGFVALLLMFAGFVRGAGFFVANEWLVPGYHTEIARQQLEMMLESGNWPDSVRTTMEESPETILRYLHNPIVCIVSGALSMFDLVLLFVPPIFLRQKQVK